MMVKKYRILCLTTVLSVFLLTGMGTADVAYSPRGNLYIWEPCQWENHPKGVPASNASAVESRVKDQDYIVYRLVDNTINDDDYGGCTLSNFMSLQHAGLLYVATHGAAGLIGAVWGEDKQLLIENWTKTEPLLTVHSCFWGFAVYVPKEWPELIWKPMLDSSNAFVFITACHSSDQNPSFLDKCGGRVGFGYPGCVWPATSTENNKKLFGRMNGSLENATMRKAGLAYDGGAGYYDDLDIVGNGDTTLCPAVVKVQPTGTVDESGSGYIEFDTYMDDDTVANEALSHIVVGGNCTISNEQWDGDAKGKYKIAFDWTGAGDFTVHMEAEAEYCTNWTYGGHLDHRLDGNGVAPNADDKMWNFQHGSGCILEADKDTIPPENGKVNFTLKGGSGNAYRSYVLMGSISGTQPGTPLPGGFATLPLNWDYFTTFTLAWANTQVFSNFQSKLDALGKSTAQMNLSGLGSVSPGCVGVVLYFAYALHSPWDSVSNPVAIQVVHSSS